MKANPRAVVVLGAILVACGARGQSQATPWRYSAAVSYYDVPHSEDFWNPIFTADHGRLHLEARHNYVAIDTSSLWAGVNFSAGSKWSFAASVLFGIVGGSVEGVGTGYELTLNREWFTLESQGEYVYDPRQDGDDSLYSWTELTGSPVDWCRLGLLVQTTNNYGKKDDVQPGVVLAFGHEKWEFETDVLDPDRDDTTFIFTLTFTF